MYRNYDGRFFRFWCHKILPLVYDDSLSYYEVLCKLTKVVNQLVEDMQNAVDYVGKYKVTYNDAEHSANIAWEPAEYEG